MIIACLQFAVFLLILLVRDVRVGAGNAFIPVIDAFMCLGDLVTVTLLYAQASVFRSRALFVLGAGFVYTALLLVPHALTVPGAFAPNGLLGAGVDTTGWLAFFRRALFPIAVILYVVLKRADSAEQPQAGRPATGIVVGVLAAIALAAAVTVLTTLGQALLPPLYVNHFDLLHGDLDRYEAVVFALLIVATTVLFRNRTSVLDVWLLVAFSSFLIQSLLIMTLRGRFTAGWYGLYLMMLVSHLVVTLALIAESNRLYARLAVALAAGNRERESRLMALDALAAAISHEAGQPLTGAITGAMAGLRWLERTPPDVERATDSMRATLDAARRTAAVMKSVRTMFAKQPSRAAEFDLNELVRETVSLLDRELAGGKVSLELALDEALSLIVANRVQVQQVLVNLIANAIESVSAMQDRPRRIAIRSALVDGEDVLLEISDNGIGIAPAQMARVFDAFFTTKPTGTGLGLSICRSIVETYGGHLWASHGEPYGATFHLQLPRGGSPPR